MLRQSKNKVKIEGILAEIDLKPISYERDGKSKEAIGGSIKVKVKQVINGIETDLEIPVHMFATKFTNKGMPNPAYDSIKKVADTYVSIAQSNEDTADRVRITGADIGMNEYATPEGTINAYPRIRASFVNKISKNECTDTATFEAEMVVLAKDYEVAADGVETGRYKVQTALVQYGEKVDLVPFYGASEGVVNAISQYWNVGDTVVANGKLNFSAKTETTTTDVDFGEPTQTTRTINVSELIITGGSQAPLDGEFAYDFDEIQEGLVQRKARLDDLKKKRQEKPKAPANNFNAQDLGF